MGLGIGASKSKSKSTSDTSTTYDKTSTPTNPEWVTGGAQGLAGGVMDLAGRKPESFFAGASPLQDQQFGLAGQLGGQSMGWLQDAAKQAQGGGAYSPQQMTGASIADPSHVQGETAYGGIANYMNPYQQQVIDSGLADNERSRQMAGINTAAQATAAHAFGGSRHGVADAETNAGYDRNAQSFIGNLRQQGFNTALGAAQSDADRAQQAGIFNAGADNTAGLAGAGFRQQAGLANQQAGLAANAQNQQGSQFSADMLRSLGLSGYDALSGAGATQQGLAQQIAGAPLSVQQQLSTIFGNLPLGLFQGGTEKGTEVGKSKGTGSQFGVSASASYGGK